MDIVKNERITKILSILAFVFIILALTIIAITPPSSGYEISIYNVFPWYFWLFIICSIALGQIVILFDIFKRTEKENKFWITGLLVILVGISILIFMPYIRGYVTYGSGDHLSHIGTVKDIISYGGISQYNFYPNIHILTSILAEIGNISVISLATFLTRFFPFLFVLGFIIFSRFFLENRNEFLLSIVFSSLFLFFGSFGNYLTPSLQFFLFLPLILFLYFKRSKSDSNIAFDILFIIFSIGLVFYHPLTFLFLLVVFSMSAVSTFIFPKYKKRNKITNKIEPEKEKVMTPVLLLTVVFVTWYFSFSSIIGNFVEVLSSIFYGTGESPFSAQILMVSKYTVLLPDLLRTGMFTYGIYFIIGFLSLFSIFYLFYRLFWKNDKQVSQYKFLFLSSCIFLFSGLTVLSYFFDFVVNWQRFFLYVNFFSLMLIPMALHHSFKSGQKSFKKTGSLRKFSTIIIIIFLILPLSVFTFYNSPLRNQPSIVVCSEECIGFAWFIKNRNITYSTDELGISQKRFYDAFHQNNSVSDNLRYLDAAPPDHFGYNHSAYLGLQYDTPNYLIVSTLGRIAYPSLYPNYRDDWRFTEKDFQMLLDDSTVFTVYSNSGFDVFFINSQ